MIAVFRLLTDIQKKNWHKHLFESKDRLIKFDLISFMLVDATSQSGLFKTNVVINMFLNTYVWKLQLPINIIKGYMSV